MSKDLSGDVYQAYRIFSQAWLDHFKDRTAVRRSDVESSDAALHDAIDALSRDHAAMEARYEEIQDQLCQERSEAALIRFQNEDKVLELHKETWDLKDTIHHEETQT